MRGVLLAVLTALLVGCGQRFDAERWKAGAPARNTVVQRAGMAEDFLRRYDAVGMTRAELVALLGEPDETDKFVDYDLVYWLGPERGLVGVDSEWLVFRLGDAGTATEARIVAD